MSDKIELTLVLEKLPGDVQLLGDFVRVDQCGKVQFTSPRYTRPIHGSYYARLPRQIDLNEKPTAIDNWVPVSERLPDYKGDNDWCIVTSVTGAVNGALIDRDGSLPGWAIAWLDEPFPAAYVPPEKTETVGFDEAKEIAKTHMVKRADDDTTFWFVRKGDRLVTLDDRNYPLTLSDLDAQFVVGKRHTEDSDAPT